MNINTLRFGFLTLVMLLIGAVSSAQLHPVLDSFDIVQSGDVIEFRFAIKGGSSCTGVDLERSADGENYSIVGFIPGVCGGSANTEYYIINDEMPVIGSEVLYRLRLGAQGWSEPQTVTFISLFDGVNIYPNPGRDNVKVKINNPGGNPWSFTVLKPNGQIWLESDRLFGSDQSIDVSSWSAGVYYLRISIQEESIIRRLLID